VDGTSPLHHAARYGHVETMQLLLDAGAAKDVRDRRAKGACGKSACFKV